MTFDWINKAVVGPIFFFLSLVLGALTGVSLFAAFTQSTGFVIVSLFLFVLAFNAFRLGWKLYHEAA